MHTGDRVKVQDDGIEKLGTVQSEPFRVGAAQEECVYIEFDDQTMTKAVPVRLIKENDK